MDKTGRTNPPGYDVKSEEKAPASPFLHQTKVSFEFTEYLGTSPAQFFLLLWVENISSIAQSPVRAKRVEDSSFIQPRRCSGLWERGAQWLVFLGDTKVRVPVEGSVPWKLGHPEHGTFIKLGCEGAAVTFLGSRLKHFS